jgi:ABC-type multidrug transport system ATPase subunit
LFYARVKGIPPKEESEAVEKAIASVSLQNFRNRLSKGLSGGEKRRLSIAIALIGSPKAVFFGMIEFCAVDLYLEINDLNFL